MSSSGEIMDLPCLAFHRCGCSTTLFSVSEHKPIIAGGMDELLTNKLICPTAQGLLLVRDPATAATFLCDPRDGGTIHLPPLHGMEDKTLMDSHCLLSNKPSSPGCVVLLVEGGDNTFIWYCRPGDDHWVRHEYDIGTQVLDTIEEGLRDKNTICPIAACRGKFYFNSLGTEMGVLEFNPAGPVFSSMEIDNSAAADGSRGYKDDHGCGEVRLVESCGELYMVSLMYASVRSRRIEICRATVHRMDFAARRWRRVDDLGGRVFLVSLFYFGASCPGGVQGLRDDCVYLVYPVKKALQVFDVKEGTNEMEKLEEAPSSDKAFWVLPTIP